MTGPRPASRVESHYFLALEEALDALSLLEFSSLSLESSSLVPGSPSHLHSETQYKHLVRMGLATEWPCSAYSRATATRTRCLYCVCSRPKMLILCLVAVVFACLYCVLLSYHCHVHQMYPHLMSVSPSNHLNLQNSSRPPSSPSRS